MSRGLGDVYKRQEFNSKQKEPLFPPTYEAPILIDKYDGETYEEGDEYIYWSN